MMVHIGNFFFRYRNSLFPLAFLIVLMPGPAMVANPLVATLLGLLVATVGQALRVATIGLQYIVRGGRDRRVYAEDMVTEGLYAHCRNPMYVGNLLILTGMIIVANRWPPAAVALPFFTFVYMAIVAAEEAYLQQRFGAAFLAYAAAVPRWRIQFKGIAETFAASRFRWRRAVLKEYGTPFGWLMGALALSLWNLWRAGLWHAREDAVTVLVAAMLATVVVWAIIRSLKKSRILVTD
jgi:protein-S-isoprenylcysteine O-methyltransferase Ste14